MLSQSDYIGRKKCCQHVVSSGTSVVIGRQGPAGPAGSEGANGPAGLNAGQLGSLSNVTISINNVKYFNLTFV